MSPEHTALPPVVDHQTWRAALDELRNREKAATRELDAIAAQRRRLPMVELPDYTLVGADGPLRLVDVFDGRSQLIVYHHMWSDGAEWQCSGCTGFTSQFTRLEFLENYDARFVIVTNGPIEEALAYKRKVGNRMEWYSSSQSPFAADMDAPPGGGFGVNVFLRDGDTVYRTWHTNGARHRATESLVRADRHSAVGSSRGLARFAGRVAVAAHLLGVARLPRYCSRLRIHDDRGHAMSAAEGYVVTRTIAATPAEVFTVLADPSRHQDTEPTDWVRNAVDTAPITGAGQMFAMNMYLIAAGGDYVTHNLVHVFERDRAIAWMPGALDDAGNHTPGGWFWRYDLVPNGDRTDVTLTYDWSGTPQAFRDRVGEMPIFGEDYLATSLAALERSVAG